MRRLVAAIAALALLVAPAVASALSVTEVAEELRCPTCETPLDVSNAPVAQQMKAQIAQRIEDGATKRQIIDEFVAEFGPSVRATPEKHGFDLVAWLLPALGIAAGLCAIPFVTRAWAKRRPQAAPPVAPLSGEDRERVERELDAFGDG